MHFEIRLRALLLAILLVGVFATVSAWGQSSNGSVRGLVEDASNAVIPQADVALTNTATGNQFKSKTNEVGLFVFPAIAPGPYKIEVEYAGMAKYEGTVTVRVQESANITVTLKPATTQTAITVVDATPVVVSDNATLGHTLERRRIEQLPINGRQIMNLLQTVAGITVDVNGAIRTNGTRPGTHDFTLDGAAQTDALDGGATFRRQPGLDTIQEFRVENTAVSAKNPRQTNIIMTTKSGTNEVHGSLFETNRNGAMGVARARQNLTNSAAHYIRNEFGGTIGGPVSIPKVYNGKNKTFWFFSYEGLRLPQGQIKTSRVPTEAMRNGDFSGLRDSAGTLSRIYDPAQTDPITFQRPQFNYGGTLNRIDPSRISPLAKYLYGQLPMPNMATNPLVAPNYSGPSPDTLREWTVTGRFDHRITDNDQMYVRLTDSNSDRLRSNLPVLTDGGGNWRQDYFPSKSIAVNWTRTFSPSFFNEVTASASREYGSIYTGTPGTMWANKLGLPNPGNQDGYPVINTVGLPLGGASNYIQPQNNRIRYFSFFILDDNATKVWGKHEIQFGAHFRKDFLNFLPQQQRTGGSATAAAVATALYDPTVTNRSRGVRNTGSSAASFFLGLDDLQYRTAKKTYYMRQNEDAFYLQDNIRATQRLTLNLGVRWQMSPFAYDKYNIMTSWDPANQAIVLGQPLDYLYKIGATNPGLVANLQKNGMKFETYQQAGLPQHLVYNNWLDIGPHLGFAYRALDGRKQFVIRAGYSENFFPLPMATWNDRMRLNAPFTGFYENRPYTSTSTSPDGRRNWGLVNAPSLIAGMNTANAIDLTDGRALEIGGDPYQAAYWGSKQPSPRVHDWNFVIEKEVMSNTLVRVSYVGNHATHQDTLDDNNQTIPEFVWYSTRGTSLPDGVDATAAQRPMYKPGSPMGDIQEFRRDGYGNSTSIEVEVERRYEKGFGYQFIYVMNNNAAVGGYGYNSYVSPASSYLPGEVPTDHDARMRLLGYTRDFNIPKHDFRWNWVMDLPFGHGKKLLGNAKGVLNQFVGGWQLTGLGRLHSNYFNLINNDPSSDLWPTGNPIEYYGHKYPIKDCRSGTCYDGWLLWNGYIPAHQINQPDGIMGVPANYKPAGSPVWPYPANYNSLNSDIDPNYDKYGTNTVTVKLNDGTLQDVDKGNLHPWINQALQSTYTWTVDASLSKNFAIKDRANIRFQADFFNVFNMPGNSPTPIDNTGIVTTQSSNNDPRTLQLSLRLSW